MLPPITAAAELPAAIEYANNHPNNRWYVAKMCRALGEPDKVPSDWGDAITAARMPKLGTGKRFSNLKRSLASKGATNPGALAAWIGRRKFGAKKFGALGAKARTAGAVVADGGQPMPTSEWLRTVRSTISDAGMDPDVLESTVGGGYATAHDPEMDPVAFAESVLDKAIEELRQDPEFDEYMELLGPDGDDDETADDQAEGVEGEGDDQQPVDQAQAPANMPVPALAAGSNPIYIYGGGAPPDPAAFAEQLQPHIARFVQEAITAAYLPDEEDQQPLPGDGGPVDGDLLDAGTGADETLGDNADGMPDDLAAGPDDGTVVPDVPPAPADALSQAGVEDAKNKLRASFAAAAPPPRRGHPGRVPPATGRGGVLPPQANPPGVPAPVPPPPTQLPPSTSVPDGPFPRKRPVMAAADMTARLAAREAGGSGKADAPAEGALTAARGPFRYRHNWIPISGVNRDAEEASAKADEASKNAVGEMTHSRAAVAHEAAARAWSKAGNNERAEHHRERARQHSAEGQRPLRSNMYDDDMSGYTSSAAMEARIAERRGKVDAPATAEVAGAITAGHPYPGQLYRHGWKPAAGFDPKSYELRREHSVEIGHRGESGVTHIGSVRPHKSGHGFTATHTYDGKSTVTHHRTQGEARAAVIRGHEKHAATGAGTDSGETEPSSSDALVPVGGGESTDG